MFFDLPFELSSEHFATAAVAFLAGWILSAIVSSVFAKFRVKRRDPRDGRIRELEAELRIARVDSSSSTDRFEDVEEELKQTTIGLERRNEVISEKQLKIDRLSVDLKDSVLKTRELRAELSDRATENVHAEAKIREVETELSVAQASTDMMATGVLDYSIAPNDENPDSDVESAIESPVVKKAAS